MYPYAKYIFPCCPVIPGVPLTSMYTVERTCEFSILASIYSVWAQYKYRSVPHVIRISNDLLYSNVNCCSVYLLLSFTFHVVSFLTISNLHLLFWDISRTVAWTKEILFLNNLLITEFTFWGVKINCKINNISI